MATTVDVPTANRMETENRKFTKGEAIFTADRATSDTPLATNIPSTMVYSAKIHWATTEGHTNLQNFFFSDIPSKFMIQLLYDNFTTGLHYHHKPWYNTKVNSKYCHIWEKIHVNIL